MGDVARVARVSVGTVDRVLNGRGSVHPETEKAVLAAARALRLDRALDLRPTRLLRLGVLMQDRQIHPFYGQLIEGFQASTRHYAHLNTSVFFYFFRLFDKPTLLAKIDQIKATCDGLVIDGFDDPDVSARLAEIGQDFPVITLVSDLPDSRRLAYVGCDARASGRAAGELMGRYLNGRSGSILVITGLRSFILHEQQELGFRGVIAERFPELRTLETVESLEKADLYDIVCESFRRHQDLVGIFNISTGNESIARALVDINRARQTVFITYSLTPPQRALLKDGIVDVIIDQSGEELARIAVENFLIYHGRLPQKARPDAPRFSIHISENS